VRALVFVGAFNPLTEGHLASAENALREIARGDSGFARVVFVPSRMGYIRGEQHKDMSIPDGERFRMLCLAAEKRPWMMVSDIELRSASQPRTYSTLCRLRDERGIDGMLLIGSDKLSELQSVWRHVEEIGREFGIAVMSRNHDDTEKLLETDPYLRALRPYVKVVRSPGFTQDISSTQVRKLLREAASEPDGDRKEKLLRGVRACVPDEILPVLLDWMNRNAQGTAAGPEEPKPEYLPEE
jgi:nicotinate (nicotinamide) nucleotide adenylyltransferase